MFKLKSYNLIQLDNYLKSFTASHLLLKPRRESASHVEEFFKGDQHQIDVIRVLSYKPHLLMEKIPNFSAHRLDGRLVDNER